VTEPLDRALVPPALRYPVALVGARRGSDGSPLVVYYEDEAPRPGAVSTSAVSARARRLRGQGVSCALRIALSRRTRASIPRCRQPLGGGAARRAALRFSLRIDHLPRHTSRTEGAHCKRSTPAGTIVRRLLRLASIVWEELSTARLAPAQGWLVARSRPGSRRTPRFHETGTDESKFGFTVANSVAPRKPPPGGGEPLVGARRAPTVTSGRRSSVLESTPRGLATEIFASWRRIESRDGIAGPRS